MVVTPVQAKLASMLAIGVGSFVVGTAPACFVSRVQDLQQKLLLSCTLCFGGGVLLATSFLHMLPETRESMPEYAELIFSGGFMLLYLIDESVHYFWGNETEHDSELHQHPTRGRPNATRGERCRGHSHQVSYSTAGQWNPRNAGAHDHNAESVYQANFAGSSVSHSWKNTNYGAVQYTSSAPAACCNEQATFLCHGNHTEPCADSNTGAMGILVALTVHSVLEGLAIGLQKATSEVLLLVGAVASHKFVVGFCLGLELAGAGCSIPRLLLAIFVFSGGSAIGIGVGMLTLGADKDWTSVALPLLQGLAGGTLLYVTVSEVLPRERARWHRSSRRSAGILQFFSATVGFIVVYLLNSYVGT